MYFDRWNALVKQDSLFESHVKRKENVLCGKHGSLFQTNERVYCLQNIRFRLERSFQSYSIRKQNSVIPMYPSFTQHDFYYSHYFSCTASILEWSPMTFFLTDFSLLPQEQSTATKKKRTKKKEQKSTLYQQRK